MYDLDLIIMFKTDLPLLHELNPNTFIGLSASEVMLFYSDGSMVVMNSESMLGIVRKGSIFNIKGEDYL